MIGDFLGASGRNLVNPNPALEMHESEAAVQAVVDPYARADFFISFGEEGVNLEEGFLTFTELPGGLLTKVGKMRAAFGKVNTLHNHVLPWTDRPIVINNLVGGEDGIDDAGFSVARLIPNKVLFLEATGQVFRGDSGDNLFKTSQRGDLSYVGHLRAYQDITENSNLDFGVSYAHGHNPSGIVGDVEFCLSVARVLLPDHERAAIFVRRALAETVDRRLRFLLLPALAAIARNDAEAAARWLDRATVHEQSRRPPGD